MTKWQQDVSGRKSQEKRGSKRSGNDWNENAILVMMSVCKEVKIVAKKVKKVRRQTDNEMFPSRKKGSEHRPMKVLAIVGVVAAVAFIVFILWAGFGGYAALIHQATGQ